MATFYTHGVEEFSYTSGTGPYIMVGATPNMRTFADKVPNGSAVTYKAWDGARSEYAYGIFEYPSTLHRRAILSSSNGDQPIDWQVNNQRLITLIPDPVFSGVVLSGTQLPETLVPCPFPEDGECGQVLTKGETDDCHDNTWEYLPYPILLWLDGEPYSSQKFRYAVTEALRFPADFAGSYAYADYAPDSPPAVVIVNRVQPDGTVIQLGTITFGGGEYLTLNAENLTLGGSEFLTLTA